tara:strand:- start:202 stop:357 length:156 start_codon:yes stop_codon:yes gene_type:complete
MKNNNKFNKTINPSGAEPSLVGGNSEKNDKLKSITSCSLHKKNAYQSKDNT